MLKLVNVTTSKNLPANLRLAKVRGEYALFCSFTFLFLCHQAPRFCCGRHESALFAISLFAVTSSREEVVTQVALTFTLAMALGSSLSTHTYVTRQRLRSRGLTPKYSGTVDVSCPFAILFCFFLTFFFDDHAATRFLRS